MKLKKLYHVGIPVDDLDRAREFYTKVLGMEFMGRAGGDRGVARSCRHRRAIGLAVENRALRISGRLRRYVVRQPAGQQFVQHDT